MLAGAKQKPAGTQQKTDSSAQVNPEACNRMGWNEMSSGAEQRL